MLRGMLEEAEHGLEDNTFLDVELPVATVIELWKL
jgi:hypothetical protein